jgi:ribosome-binding factor A
MQPIRRARLEAVILEELSKVVPRELKDPRIASVTFTGCQVTPDGSQATVLVTLLGAHALEGDENAKAREENEKKLKDCIKGLTSAAGFLRRHLASVLTVRHIPTISFKADKGFENTYRVHELLKKISSEPPSEGN